MDLSHRLASHSKDINAETLLMTSLYEPAFVTSDVLDVANVPLRAAGMPPCDPSAGYDSAARKTSSLTSAIVRSCTRNSVKNRLTRKDIIAKLMLVMSLCEPALVMSLCASSATYDSGAYSKKKIISDICYGSIM